MNKFASLVNNALDNQVYPKHPRGLYEPIAYTLAGGGKRLRPSLMLLCYSLYKTDFETVLPAAIGLETYHNHTLLHDDLMDAADVRRGMPTVHRKWDANTAILSGDTMLIQAVTKVNECRCKRKEDVMQLFLQTCREVCEGQQYDMNFESRTDVCIDEYIEMIRLKTAVLVACAAKMGGLIADAPEVECEMLYSFAEKVGLAFQLQDDYLDVYGDPLVFGKKIGGDILCGKKTLLLISAFNRANEKQRNELHRLLESKDLSDAEKIEGVTKIYNDLHIPEISNEMISAYYDDARNIYETLPLPEEVKEPLWQWAIDLLGRNY